MTSSPRRLFLGGELHNSSASNAASLREAFRRVRELGADTVLAPVSWETIEPREGVFDLSLVDTALETAETYGLDWVPLWFGAWKNGASTYVPGWVKRDGERFPRAQSTAGAMQHISPFGDEIAAADATAFAQVLARIKKSGAAHIVPFVQVENEPGLLGARRDESDVASACWHRDVPDAVIAAVRNTRGRLRSAWESKGRQAEGSWSQVFGPEADEAFMAWAYATHIEKVAARGKAELGVPLYVNAWLDAVNPMTPADELVAGGAEPGSYPSGGPVPHLLPLWRALTPSIDFYSPDIYFGDFDATCGAYAAVSDRLVIPEMRRDQLGIAHMFRAIGEHNAELVAPFGLDSLHAGAPDHDEIVDAYGLLAAMRETVVGAPSDSVRGFFVDRANPVARLTIGEFDLVASLDDPRGMLDEGEIGFGIAVDMGSALRVAGRGFLLQPAEPVTGRTGLASVIERARGLEVHRVLNGDETGGGNEVRFHRLYSGRGQGVVPFDTRFTGIIDIELYHFE
jgi:hypothetical protein